MAVSKKNSVALSKPKPLSKRTRNIDFLEKLPSEERAILEQITTPSVKDEAKKLSELAVEIGNSEYVTVEDKGVSINKILLSKAYATLLRKDEISFKELNELQKVTENVVTENSFGVIIQNMNDIDLTDR